MSAINQPLYGATADAIRDQLDRSNGDAITEQDITNLLLHLAARLTNERPTDPMREATRLSLALEYAAHRYGYGTGRAYAAEQAVLQRAPRVDRDLSRGEYALLLRKAAAGGDR
ncbi:hypothetical protein [Streptomyces enissocaesilis]|uniref:Uncharacterized protein n=1 Tax=Streptomyces enissocaesilis TaxID=332589 RepID=A0ABN3XNH6_9ACTN